MKAALIGAGHIARQHLACLRTLPGVEIAGICDLSRARSESACERFGAGRPFTSARRLIDETRPDVVHVTTPPASHFSLVMDALAGGAHVIVEKPAALSLEDVARMAAFAREKHLALVENYNYVFNDAPRRIRALIDAGHFGAVTHVDVFLALNILVPGGAFNDPDLPHPLANAPGGPLLDFLPHLVSLAHAFMGEALEASGSWTRRAQSALPFDEFRGLLAGRGASATLAFSANTGPDAFWLRVYGTRMQAVANLFETRLTINGPHKGPRPLVPFVNAWQEARSIRRSAFSTLRMKVDGGPGTYGGLWRLLTDTYRRLQARQAPPVTIENVLAVNGVLARLLPEGAAA